MKKVRKQATIAEPTEAERSLAQERLRDIFSDHHISYDTNRAFYGALLDWKKQI